MARIISKANRSNYPVYTNSEPFWNICKPYCSYKDANEDSKVLYSLKVIKCY